MNEDLIVSTAMKSKKNYDVCPYFSCVFISLAKILRREYISSQSKYAPIKCLTSPSVSS